MFRPWIVGKPYISQIDRTGAKSCCDAMVSEENLQNELVTKGNI